MAGVSIKPVLRLIARHGEEIYHHRLPRADSDAPWQIETGVDAGADAGGGAGGDMGGDAIAAQPPAVIRGLIRQITAAPGDDDVFGSGGDGFRAVAVLALGSAAVRPLPGDVLVASEIRWRVVAVAPLARHRSGELLEARLVSHAGARTDE